MLKRGKFVSLSLLLSMFSILSQAAQVVDVNEFSLQPLFRGTVLDNIHKNYIPKTVTLEVTPSGLQKINGYIPAVVRESKMDKGNLGSYAFGTKSVKLEKLADLVPKDLDTLKPIVKMFIANIIESALRGASHQIQIEDINYNIDLQDVQLSLDPSSKQDNVIFNVNIALKNFSVDVRSILYKEDPKHPFIGDINISKLKTAQAKVSNPLQIVAKVKMFFDAQYKMGLHFYEIKDNFDKLNLDVSFESIRWENLTAKRDAKGKLLLNDKESKSNQKVLNDSLKTALKQHLKSIQMQVHKHIAHNTFAEEINSTATEIMARYTEIGLKLPSLFVQDEVNSAQDIYAGFLFKNLGFINQSLILQMDGFVESGIKNIPMSVELVDPFNSAPYASFLFNKTKADTRILLNAEFINRYLQINFENGLLNDLYLDEKFSDFTFVESPRVEVMTQYELRDAQIHQDPNILYVKGTGTIKLDLNDSDKKEQVSNLVTVKGTVLMSFKHVGDNSFQVLIHHIYSSSLVTLEKEEPSLGKKISNFFSDGVAEYVKNTVTEKLNTRLKKEPINLISTLNLTEKDQDSVKILPSEILGLKVKFQSITPLSKDLLSIELEYK